ncbi:hypothetical protein HDU96_002815, partial [Phlyctochytrium bullatum]
LDVKMPRVFPLPQASSPGPQAMADVRLACWNANSLSALCRKLTAMLPSDGSTEPPILDGLLKYLDERHIDMICLQETMLSLPKKSQETVPPPKRKLRLREQLCQLRDWHVVGNDSGDGRDGVVTLLRKSAIDVKSFTVGFDSAARAFESSVIAVGDGRCITVEVEGAYIVNVYVPNGTRNASRFAYKMQFLRELYEFVKKLRDTAPVILTGDFNIALTDQD